MPLQVKLFAADATGCGWYRCRVPSAAIASSGFDVESIVVHNDENPDHQLDVIEAGHIDDMHIVRVEDPQCDVVVLQRPMHRSLVEAIPHIQAHGVAVVVEIDDLFHRIHPGNPAYALSRPDLSPEMNITWLERAMSAADLITVSTDLLAKFYGRFGPTQVVRNYVPESTLRKPVESDRVVFGWTGRTDTHAGDLDTIGRSLASAMLSMPTSEFFTVGDHRTVRTLGVPEKRSTSHAWLPVDQLAESIDAIGIGIVPLALNDFNAAKSWIKGLEYSARGIPFVAAPTPEYERLHQMGAGDLARTERKWETTLLKLALDADYRAERARSAYDVATELTIENNVGKWAQAWADARSLRRGG